MRLTRFCTVYPKEIQSYNEYGHQTLRRRTCCASKQQLHLNSVEGSTHENSDNISVAHDTLHRRVAGLPRESQPRAADDNFPEISRHEYFENIFFTFNPKIGSTSPNSSGQGQRMRSDSWTSYGRSGHMSSVTKVKHSHGTKPIIMQYLVYY